jgi:Rrf2 family nitric oxide-sensitive transcriptional repressor
VECFGSGSTCTLTGHCGLASVIQGALLSFMGHLDAQTLADVLPKGAKASPDVQELQFVPTLRSRTDG